MQSRSRGLIAATFILASIMACAGGQDLNGAGATFPYPIYSKWFSDYARESGVRINYQSIGSASSRRGPWISAHPTPRCPTPRWPS